MYLIRFRILLLVFILFNLHAAAQPQTFENDARFLKRYTRIITLSGVQRSKQILVAPEWQGRIMTSTANGNLGRSHGWVNYSFIEKESINPNINPYGGMDRLWLGPLGSQFSLFYQGKEFDDKYWHVPHDFDRKSFRVIQQGDDFVEMYSEMKFSNFIHTAFHVGIERRVNLLSSKQVEANLKLQLSADINYVGYETLNTMKNLGSDWNFDIGTLALWSLAQIRGNDNTVVIIPLRKSTATVNTYLADIPGDRMVISDKEVLVKGDGKFRSKIGIPPESTIPLFGSLDLQNNILTIIQFQFEDDSRYFNSDLGFQDEPYKGDVISIYNNDPVTVDGRSEHSFFELESASSMKELKQGEKATHLHRTFVFEGNQDQLYEIVDELLGAERNQIERFNNQ